MKKQTLFLTMLLLVTLSFLLASCQGGGSGTTVPSTTTAATTTVPPVTEPPKAPYEELACRPATGFGDMVFGFSKDSTLIELSYPTDWTISAADDGFEILRDGSAVGYLCGSAAPDAAAFTVLKTDELSGDGLRITRYIEQKSGEERYRYRYVYRYSTNGYVRLLTLVAAYEEVDERSANTLLRNAELIDRYVSDTVGVLAPYFEYLGGPSSVAILGNSFVNSSKIGNNLREMMENGGWTCEVTAISRGYARVGTYTSDAAMMAKIRAGEYDVIFICGFYGEAEVENLGILREACIASGTELVIFPAHNEGASIIAAAEAAYPDLLCLNWKAEINRLIEGGVDKWDMCIDDAHDHSTPLAGYVGAHMIYRALYDELPTAPMKNTLTQSNIDRILGDYTQIGDAIVFPAGRITFLD